MYGIAQNYLSVKHWYAYLVFCFALVCIQLLICRRNRVPLRKSLLTCILIIYLEFVAVVTLLGREPASEFKAKPIFLWSWHEMIVNHSQVQLEQIVLNILLFFPIGILLFWRNKIHLKQALVVGTVLSAVIEILQLVTRRGLFEWDDILHNTLGCVLGCIVGELMWRRKRR